MIDAVFNGNSLGVGVESNLLELLIPSPKLMRGITSFESYDCSIRQCNHNRLHVHVHMLLFKLNPQFNPNLVPPVTSSPNPLQATPTGSNLTPGDRPNLIPSPGR